MEHAPASLAHRMGGEITISAVVDRFHQRVLGDPLLAGYFDGLDRAVLAEHQRAFLQGALAADMADWPARLREAHHHLHLGDEAFDRIVDHLLGALAGTGVPASLVEEIRTVIESVRGAVVGPGGAILPA